jgi:hypothetical protein
MHFAWMRSDGVVPEAAKRRRSDDMTASSICGVESTGIAPTGGAPTAGRSIAARFLAGVCALALSSVFTMGAAMAQDAGDPPGRIARFSLTEGAVSYAQAGGNDWTNAQLTRPVTSGDRLWVDRGSRSEMHAGSTALRLGALTHMEIVALDYQTTELNLTQGMLSVRVRDLEPGEHFQIGTPNVAVLITQPGEYRIDVDQQRDTTRVAVHSGAAVVYGENRESANVGAQQQLSFTDRNLRQVEPAGWLQRDGFDQWVQARDRQEDQSVAAHYVSREVVGYQQLDQHGYWRDEPGYGPVWFPRVAVANWAPYRYGQWRWISPWGWTWIDDAPWGFAPFHYGRWAQVGPQWAWVPGPRTYRPVYAPALVAFVGGNGGGANWNIQLNSGGPGVAWFPLGPGEAFRPAYRTSRRYFDNVNRNVVVNNNTTLVYMNQHRPGAVTAVPLEDFGRGRPGRGFGRVADADFSRAHIVEAPPTPSRTAGFAPQERPAPARALPPTAVLNQPAPPSAGNAVAPHRYGSMGFNGPDGRRAGRDERRDNAREPTPSLPVMAAQPLMQAPAPQAVAPTRDPRVRQQQEQHQQEQREQALRQQEQRMALERDQRARQEAAQRQSQDQRRAQDQLDRAQQQRQPGEQRRAQQMQEHVQRQQQMQQQPQQQQRAEHQAHQTPTGPAAAAPAAAAPATHPGPPSRAEAHKPGGADRPPTRSPTP